MTRPSIILASVAATACVLATPATAQRPVTVYGVPSASVYVSYADLNLSQADDVAALHGRIRRAASNLCMSDSIMPASILLQERACAAEAVAGARAQIERALAGLDNSRFAGGRQRTVALSR